jgi:hypothetical protein
MIMKETIMKQDTSNTTAVLAIGLILVTGAIHLFNANEAMGDATYKGALFIANGIAASIAAIGIAKFERQWGWNMGALIALSSSLAYILSRTVGLPNLEAEPDAWLEPLGFASLLAELAFVALYGVWLQQSQAVKNLVINGTILKQ